MSAYALRQVVGGQVTIPVWKTLPGFRRVELVTAIDPREWWVSTGNGLDRRSWACTPQSLVYTTKEEALEALAREIAANDAITARWSTAPTTEKE